MTDSTTLSYRNPGYNGNERLPPIHRDSRVSFHWNPLGESNTSTEMQPVYSTVKIDKANKTLSIKDEAKLF